MRFIFLYMIVIVDLYEITIFSWLVDIVTRVIYGSCAF